MRSRFLFPVTVLALAGACADVPVGVESDARFLVSAPTIAAQIITTVAGNGTEGFGGDGGPSTSASLAFPTGVAVDAAGNFFIADQINQRIRKVTTSGIITTIAGNGTFGFAGDGGPATSASFGFPLGLALDDAGNLFIADQNNNRIRKVDASGIITTAAGNGVEGFSGDGGPAVNASFRFASGVLVDAAGELLIADRNNHRVRRVDASGIVVTIAGNGVRGFSGDGGPATSASLNFPTEVAVDGAGNLYIADQLNERVRKVDASGIITTVAGNGVQGFSGDGGPAVSANLAFPLDIAVDVAGNLFIADLLNHRIRKVDASGIITTVAGNGVEDFSGDGGPATAASLAKPRAVAVDAAGQLFVADLDNHRVRKVGCSPQALIENLIHAVQELALPGRAGQAQLNAALNALSKDPPKAHGAINALQAFINFVNAQSGKKISVQEGDDLIAAAEVIIDLLEGNSFGCF